MTKPFLLYQVLVLSGHDHDQCTVNHKTKYGSVKEVISGILNMLLE